MPQLLVTAFLSSTFAATAAAALSSEEQEAWAGEEAYWTHEANREVDGFITLGDERFIGSPCGAPGTEKFDQLRPAVKAWFENIAAYGNDTTIDPQGVIVEEHFAVTDLAATTTSSTDFAHPRVRAVKIPRTWRRAGDGSKITGGMCGALAP